MAIIKHIAMKTAKYSAAIDYLTYQHDEHTQKLVTDEYGIPVLRDEYYLDGINCEPYAYDYECYETNFAFHKNQSRGEIKQHHYIISFDPKDSSECGLTCEKAQALGMEYAKKNFPGHQMLVCTHPDGHNRSGNIHVHIMMNSVRKMDVEMKDFMERDIDSRAGYKHHVTKDFMRYLKADLMKLCNREKLHQVDLLRKARRRISDREYYASIRGNDAGSVNGYRNSIDSGLKDTVETRTVRDGVDTTGPASESGIYSSGADDKNNALNLRNNHGDHGRSPFETQKDYLRRAIEDCARDSEDEESFRELLSEKYNVTLKISRGSYSYLHPERKRAIRGRSLGTDYEEARLSGIFGQNAKRTKENAGLHEGDSEGLPLEDNSGLVHGKAVNANYGLGSKELPPILSAKSNLRLVTDLQSCAKAQANAGYARKVRLTNLQKLAQTVAFVQEQGFDSAADLEDAFGEAEKRMRSSKAVLEETKKQLKSVNEQIHYTGQYLSTKRIYAAYRRFDDKNSFRKEHGSELERYREAVKYLKNANPDGRITPLSDLKARKSKLVRKRDHCYERFSASMEEYRQIKVMRANIASLLSDSGRREDGRPRRDPSPPHPARQSSR